MKRQKEEVREEYLKKLERIKKGKFTQYNSIAELNEHILASQFKRSLRDVKAERVKRVA